MVHCDVSVLGSEVNHGLIFQKIDFNLMISLTPHNDIVEKEFVLFHGKLCLLRDRECLCQEFI